VSAFSTSGIDGRVVVWDLATTPEVDLAALGISR
jgi:hypothetical protein